MADKVEDSSIPKIKSDVPQRVVAKGTKMVKIRCTEDNPTFFKDGELLKNPEIVWRSLILRNVNRKHAGIYECFVSQLVPIVELLVASKFSIEIITNFILFWQKRLGTTLYLSC